uniref:Pecanex-like protein n=1 Tax=Loa loa TaxID=7209 RepID=A0A1I7VKJ6_LOALO
MNSSWHKGTVLPTKNKLDLLLALERGTEKARLWQLWRQVIIWVLPTVYFIFDYNRVHLTTYVVEITALFICLLNLLVCFFEATKYSCYITRRVPSKLTPHQTSSLVTDQSGCSISSPPSNRNFITQWLSALHFGNWAAQAPKNPFSSNYIRHNLTSSSIGSSFNSRKSGNAFGDSTLFLHSTPLVDHHCSYVERHLGHSVPLSAKVGSRTSLRSRPTCSIQTNKQLEEYLQKSPENNELCKSALAPFSTSFGSLSSSESERIIGISKPFRLTISRNNSYEVGTAMYDDEQGRVVGDENSVVTLVTGSRIMVTDKRISLSPIPLNLIEVGNELTAEDGKGMASDAADVTRNVNNDSITFRVNHNAAKRSPRSGQGFTPPLLRRPESYERRRHSSLSPHSHSGNQFSNVVQSNGIESSPTGKQIPITSSEILNQYKMDAEDFAVAERNLRSWICQTILRPLIVKVDEINAIFMKSHTYLHLKIGHSSVEALQTAASSKSDLLKSALPYILPYLKTHEKQSYLIKRCRELCVDVCMREYNWQSGGYEPVERREEGEQAYSPTEHAWGPHLPTDAQLIWSWFAVYMDARMGTNPLVNDIEMPFSSVFYLKKPAKPSPLQCMKKSFYIYQSSTHPPHFELVLDGGRERFEVDRGTKNLWRTILLFIQHIRLFNEGQLGNIKIDENGINLACVLE